MMKLQIVELPEHQDEVVVDGSQLSTLLLRLKLVGCHRILIPALLA
jgi:hypothetical protein